MIRDIASNAVNNPYYNRSIERIDEHAEFEDDCQSKESTKKSTDHQNHIGQESGNESVESAD